MILLEGSDCVGKTTLAGKLLELLPGWTYEYCTKPPVSPYSYITWRLANAHPRIIFDRLHWSSYAYDQTYCGGLRLTAHEWRLLELVLLSRNCVVIHLTDTEENIRSRWGEDEMYPPDGLPTLLSHFHDLASQNSQYLSLLPAVTRTLPELLDLEKNLPTEELCRIVGHCEVKANDAATLLPPTQGMGATDPDFIILSDPPPTSHTTRRDDRARLPLDFGPGAEWFWQAVDRFGILWCLGYYTLTSAFESASAFASYVNRSFHQPARIVAMGDVASAWGKRILDEQLIDSEIEWHHLREPGQAREQSGDPGYEPWSHELEEALVLFGGDFA